MVYATYCTTAPRVAIVHSQEDGEETCRFFPIEKFPVYLSPVNGVIDETGFSATDQFLRIIIDDGNIMYIRCGTGSYIFSHFKEGMRVSIGEELAWFGTSASNIETFSKCVSYWFYDSNEKPISHYQYTGIPPKMLLSENSVFLYNDMLYDTMYGSTSLRNKMRVVLCFGEVFENGRDGQVVNKIYYVSKGSSFTIPSDLGFSDSIPGYPVPDGWISSQTGELYNGEPITENTMLTAYYNKTGGGKIAVRFISGRNYKVTKEKPENYKEIEIRPFCVTTVEGGNETGLYVVPKYSYDNISDELCWTSGVVEPMNTLFPSMYFGGYYVRGAGESKFELEPSLYPIPALGSIENVEFIVWTSEGRINSQTYIVEGVTTKPPYVWQNGYNINWVTYYQFSRGYGFKEKPEHKVSLNRSTIFIGRLGSPGPNPDPDPDPDPVAVRDSIIPILTAFSSNANSMASVNNFSGFISKSANPIIDRNRK